MVHPENGLFGFVQGNVFGGRPLDGGPEFCRRYPQMSDDADIVEQPSEVSLSGV
jgi:hypothetical protein